VSTGNRLVGDPGTTHFFAEAKLCAGSSNGSCYGSYQKNNNKVRFHVSPGEKIHASIDMMDHDSGSANDTVCKAQGTVGPFTAAQLKFLAASSTMFQDWNGHGECFVGWHVKRVY
jgi:hypothetical protein